MSYKSFMFLAFGFTMLLALLMVFLEIAKTMFGIDGATISWFLFFVLMFCFTFFGLLLFSLVSHYENRLRSIDAISKETLHELATPIATIKANCEVLSKSIVEQKELTRIDRISKASKRLLELYEELEWSIKNDTGKQPKTKLMPAVLIEEIMDEFEQKLSEKNLTPNLTLQSDLIEIDYHGVKKTFSNIIDNAIKYSHKNSTIDISWQNKIFCVQNRGEEIRADEIMHIFDMYYQGDTAQKGYGIGLHAVKSFCDKNGIEIKISSINSVTKVELGLTKF